MLKNIFVVVLLLSIATSVFADAIKITITDFPTGEILNETVISSEKVKATEYYVVDFADWIITAVENKANTRVTALADELTQGYATIANMNITAREELIANTTVKSRKERDLEKLNKLLNISQ